MKTNKEKNKEKIDFKHNLRLYLGFAKKYKWFFVFAITIITILSVAKIVEKFIFKELIDRGTEFSQGVIGQSVFVNALLLMALVFIGLVLVKTLGNWFQLFFINRLDAGIAMDLKEKFFNHLVGLDHKFHTTHKTGSLISRLSRGSRAIESTTDFLLFNGTPLIAQVIIVGSSILYFDALSALTVFLTAGAFVGWSFFIITKQQKYRLEANSAEDREKGNISDVFTNIESVKYFGKEKRIKGFFLNLVTNTRNRFVRMWDYYNWLESGQTLILGVGVLCLMYFPLVKFLNGELTLGTLAFIYTAFFSFTEPLFGFVWGIRRLYEAMADFQYLFEYEKIKNGIEDKPNAEKMHINSGMIEMNNVSFKYNERKILQNVNLKINPGEKIALVGHSGSGKTTLVKLLYRFYDVNSGSIKIDGEDIREVKQESLRSELSIVPQEAILFDDTIYNNILFSNPKATRQEVLQAMKFAQLDKFVLVLPKRENTIVGERGVKLSGGEKQRVSIARAILADKKILVLDEATSALDSKTEYEIQKDLKRLMEGRTSIIIAHRLSTIMHADKIVVMDKGKIVQIGKHRDLIKQKGIYEELWNFQKGGYLE